MWSPIVKSGVEDEAAKNREVGIASYTATVALLM